MHFGRTFLRTVVGGYFVGHGTQKLFGWFGGHGLDATASMFGQLGLRPPKAHAAAAGIAEAGGGAALVLGAGTPLAGSALIATMVTAIRKVHGQNGPWVTEQGYEYNLVLIALALALAETGPGSPSIDSLTGNDMRGSRWALLALLLGVLGSYGATAISQRFPAPETPAEPDPAEAATAGASD
jgi:putative oxidoreductase